MSAAAVHPRRPVAPAAIAVPRRRRRGHLAVLGALLAAAVAAATSLVFLSFGGTFATFAAVTADVPESSTAVPLNSPVEYRNVSVGKVTSTGQPGPGGLVAITLHLDPAQLGHIPAGVRATVAPVSVFGNQYVVLVPPASPGAATLAAGATIPSLQTDATASLQSTLGDLDHLLIELHPGELDAALTALAGALQGQGTSLGQTLVQGHGYLGAMLPLWPTVVKDLQTLVPVAGQVAASAPDLIGILRNSVAPSQVLSGAGQQQITQLLGDGATLASQASTLLGAIRQPFAVLAAASGPFLDDISTNPQEIAQVLAGLARWASTWSAAEANGPYLNLTATVQVANPADLGLALLGGPHATADLAAGLGAGYVNPPTYTSAAPPAAAGAHELAEPAQQQAVGDVVAGMSGTAAASPAVATLLLSPVLRTLVGGRT